MRYNINPAEWWLYEATYEDTDDLHAVSIVPEVYQYLADGVAPAREEIAKWVETNYDPERFAGLGLWLLKNKEGRLAGCVSLGAHDERSTELIYLLHPDFWGKGLATAMSWTVMQFAFQAGNIDQIIAGTDQPNVASMAVMKRLGMKFLKDVDYPMGPGVEYVYRKDFSPPNELPVILEISK